jgi:predicted dehydrogenase
MPHDPFDRRRFIKTATTSTAAVLLANTASAEPAAPPRRKVRVAVIGCGSVSRMYFPDLKASPHVELISTCDILPDRAEQAAKKFSVPNHFPHIDQLLSGPAFDLLVNLTDMQEHYHLSKQALNAGCHVWSEKPLGTTYQQAKELLDLAKSKERHILGAPTVAASPQFAAMARLLRERKIGHVAAAHASYGHGGPTFASFFYDQGGGSLFDLGVYNVTTVTGLLGPAKAVVAMTSIVTPTRRIDRKGEIQVAAEDNAMLILDHGEGVLSHVQCGFNYFTAHEHSASQASHHTLSIIGRNGSMHLAGYDWEPHGVDWAASETKGRLTRLADEKSDYRWHHGASKMAEFLAIGKKPPFTGEHAAHVAEIMAGAHQSQASGRRVQLESTFPPLAVG